MSNDKTWNELEQELLKDPEVYEEYKRLEPEYQLARQLIKARLEKQLTQEQVAKEAGVKQAYVARLESGSANPTLGSIHKVARVLNKKIALI